jgi:hypothetical protein
MNESFYDVLWVTIKENKKTFASKLTNKRKNGEPYVAEIRIVPILTSDNQIQYFVGVERDISIEDELDKLTKITISREVRMSELKEEMRKVMEQKNITPEVIES